jgi:hypothetical protein
LIRLGLHLRGEERVKSSQTCAWRESRNAVYESTDPSLQKCTRVPVSRGMRVGAGERGKGKRHSNTLKVLHELGRKKLSLEVRSIRSVECYVECTDDCPIRKEAPSIAAWATAVSGSSASAWTTVQPYPQCRPSIVRPLPGIALCIPTVHSIGIDVQQRGSALVEAKLQYSHARTAKRRHTWTHTHTHICMRTPRPVEAVTHLWVTNGG